jgi:hypothetical protein
MTMGRRANIGCHISVACVRLEAYHYSEPPFALVSAFRGSCKVQSTAETLIRTDTKPNPCCEKLRIFNTRWVAEGLQIYPPGRF